MVRPLDVPLERLRSRTSIKWREAEPDVLPLWVAEMDVLTPEPVARALFDAIAAGDMGYPSGHDYPEALAAFAEARWGWSIDPHSTALVPDVMMGAVELLRLVTAPGDAVVVTPPVYPPFYSFVEHMDRRIVEAPLDATGRLDPASLEAAFSVATAFLLANPHNPTGAVHTSAELAVVASLARRHRVRVVADEIHAPLVLRGSRFTPYLTIPGAEDAFSVISASKAWNLAGLKCAVAIAGSAAVGDLVRLPEEVSHGPSHLAAIAHTAAFRDGGAWLDALVGALEMQRALLGRLLEEQLPLVSWIPPQGTYLAWLDCRHLGLGEGTDPAGARGNVHANVGPAAAFHHQGRVLLSSGAAFGTGGEGFVRLNFATSPEILGEAVRRMATVIAS
jgi:cystathionine beta-lyase